FPLLGWARDLKGDKYRVSYAMLVSRERDIFAVIGVGSILNIPLAATWLHTPTADGKSFYCPISIIPSMTRSLSSPIADASVWGTKRLTSALALPARRSALKRFTTISGWSALWIMI